MVSADGELSAWQIGSQAIITRRRRHGKRTNPDEERKETNGLGEENDEEV